ncbi:MAG: hypothetical protein WB697_10580 [Stellaceae bacterium]
MKTLRGIVLGIVLALLPSAAIAQHRDPNIVKVPCRDLGDGRTLIDSSYLPDWAAPDTRWDAITSARSGLKAVDA